MLDWFQAKVSISALEATLANASIAVRWMISVFFTILLARHFLLFRFPRVVTPREGVRVRLPEHEL